MQKVVNIIKHNMKWMILFICILIFLSLTEDVFEQEIMQGDIIGYQWIANHLINNHITPIMKMITWFGSATCLIIITVLLWILIKNKRIGLLATINLITITVLNQVLKFIIQRPRPTEYRIIEELGYSFPSGHSMVSMAFYGLLIYFIYKHIKNKYIKWALICILSILILSIGISRIYLGVHYVSDVCAGFVVSIAYLIVFLGMTNKLKIKI